MQKVRVVTVKFLVQILKIYNQKHFYVNYKDEIQCKTVKA